MMGSEGPQQGLLGNHTTHASLENGSKRWVVPKKVLSKNRYRPAEQLKQSQAEMKIPNEKKALSVCTCSKRNMVMRAGIPRGSGPSKREETVLTHSSFR